MRKTPSGSVKVFKTAKFKIHNPSKRKRAMLLDSMKRTHLAFERLLNKHFPSPEELTRLSKLSRKERQEALRLLTKAIQRDATILGVHLSVSAKASISQKLLGLIKSQIELQEIQETTGRPIVPKLNAYTPEYEKDLEDFIHTSLFMEETEARNQLMRVSRAGTYLPLEFVRTGWKDGFLMLSEPKFEKLWVWLNLHNTHSRFAKPVTVPHPQETRNLVDIKTEEIIKPFTSQTGERFSLELDQHYHIKEYLDKEGEPVTARVVWIRERQGHSCDEFELHVSFCFIVPKVVTKNWIGVDRGIYNLLAYAITDDRGVFIKAGRAEGRSLRYTQRRIEALVKTQQKKGYVVRGRKRRAHADEAVHVAANLLVEAAYKNKAQIVFEDLKNLGAQRYKKRVKGQRRSNFNVLLNRSQYEKLKNIVIYKAALKGLTKPVFVSAAYTSQTCPKCAHQSSKNREKKPSPDGFDMAAFKCVECAYEADADENAAHIIALKGRWLRNYKEEKKRGNFSEEEMWFQNHLKRLIIKNKGLFHQ